MPTQSVKTGSTSVILPDVFLQDSSQTDDRGLAGLVFNTASLTCYYHRNTANASVAVSLATMTLGTWASGGFLEVDATHMPGVYSFCPPDAAFAAGAQSVTFYFRGAANLKQTPYQISLVILDPQQDMTITQNINQTRVRFCTTSGFQQITSMSTAKTLTIPADARGVILSAEGQHVRFRNDGTDPTASIGNLIRTTDNPLILEGASTQGGQDMLAQLKFIEATSGGILNCTFFQ